MPDRPAPPSRRSALATALVLALAWSLPTTSPAQPAHRPAPRRPADGRYRFEHRYAEHPSLPGFAVTVVVRKGRVSVINPQAEDQFPRGTIDGGLLLWNHPTRQWIIGQSADDAHSDNVGGCSDGPSVVDFQRRIYWTC